MKIVDKDILNKQIGNRIKASDGKINMNKEE
jgi:hypothetical protein